MVTGEVPTMDGGVRPSAGLLVIIVFCLAVLLGIGGTSAFALWQQAAQSSVGHSAESSASSTP
ncbi:hypothetical protein ACIPY2_08435 [Paenarthrobacter sp. NPDC089675]|uniref:hypothetical protein n=1 Tax=Paenarthrobacter sp. NPDC089675 TaxID=3364376 RepID=UPI00382EE76F